MRALVLAGIVVAVACDPSDAGSSRDRIPRSDATPDPEREPEHALAVEPEPEAAGVGGLAGALFGDASPIAEIYEADAIPEGLRGNAVRVHGWVQPGSIMQRRAPAGIRFGVVRGDTAITVEHAGPVPERFQEKLEVIVSGRLSEDGTRVQADELIAKCPDDYEALPVWPEDGGPS